MKKFLTLFFVALLACCIVGCDNEITPPVESSHTHNYSTTYLQNNTTHWQQCSCGNKRNVEEHDYNAGVITLQPTETKKGIKTYTCYTCGREKTEELPVKESPNDSTQGPATSHTHSSAFRSRVGNRWEHLCGCGQVYYENIDFYQEIVNFAITNGDYTNYTYKCMVGSDVSNGYTYSRYVAYDSVNQELCFTLTFGQYMKLEIYISGISREYNYYFEDKESHYFIRGIIDTTQCVSTYFCYTDKDNIINTNATGAMLYEFAEVVQSQVKLFIACFNNDFSVTYVTAQDFCFPALN